MVDIVERLRHPMMVMVPVPTLNNSSSGTSRAALEEEQAKVDMAEAADEIERLRNRIMDLEGDQHD